jgi:hypothetical protein
MFNMDEAFMINTILIIINIYDTIGRYLVVRVIPSKKLIYIVILARTLLLIFISIFCLFNIITLALYNEVGISLCF